MSMSWNQTLTDVTSRFSAASQSLQTFDPSHYLDPARYLKRSSTIPSNETCRTRTLDSQSSSMSVRVQLDQQNASSYTNLDIVSGQVILSLATDTTISAINVKLEGESRTRLSGPRFPNDPANRQKIELEVHKLLYEIQTVFPSANIAQDSTVPQYTLPAGQYIYPFSLKIPFNNDCMNNSKLFQDIRLNSLLGPGAFSSRHVKQTLPPTLGGYPGEAEVKYFVKATVVRPKFYQENIRSVVDIKFQPIEPPRPETRSEETYARRQHQFQAYNALPKGRKTSIFKPIPVPQPDEQPLVVRVEARLPNPAIITCHDPLPLRILVEKLNDSPASVYLSLLQLELFGTTSVRAQDLNRIETGSWIIMSQANMNFQLDTPADRSGRSFQIPSRFWDNLPLPNTIVPSFQTCNLSRSYELEIRVGIMHGLADGPRPELIVLPLRLPVHVYSGVVASQHVPNRISTQQPPGSNLNTPRPTANHYAQHSPITPVQDQYPPQPGSYMAPPTSDPNDLPPTYEDAIAEDIAPVDGPRRDFSNSGTPGAAQQQTPIPSKKYSSGLNRHGSERLFAQNAPSPPTASAGLTNQSPLATNQSSVPPLSGLDVDGFSPTQSERPPPLPARKGTVDSVKNQKNSV